MTHSHADQAGTHAPEHYEASHHAPQSSASEVERDQEKRWQTIRAQLALKGYCIARAYQGDGPPLYLITRLSQRKEFRSLDQVSDFIGRIEA